MRVSVGVVLFAAAGALQGAAPGALAAGPAKHVVTIDGSKYEPATITSAGKFDSRNIAANARWSWRAKAAGEYAYICTLHPNMKGTVVVQ